MIKLNTWYTQPSSLYLSLSLYTSLPPLFAHPQRYFEIIAKYLNLHHMLVLYDAYLKFLTVDSRVQPLHRIAVVNSFSSLYLAFLFLLSFHFVWVCVCFWFFSVLFVSFLHFQYLAL